MLIDGKKFESIWPDPDGGEFFFTFDQRQLPFRTEIIAVMSWQDTESAIKNMTVRGAPLIGVTAAYGIWLACCEAAKKGKNATWIMQAAETLKNARPTAVNLSWAIDRMLLHLFASGTNPGELKTLALAKANEIARQDIETCKTIGKHGLKLIRDLFERKKSTVNILTHCNAGWLATVDWGTATAPMYLARHEGIPIHIWVDETRPRNQGLITSWELTQNNIPNTLITDNAGGLLMMKGKVDMVITGADRVTAFGDVANKIGTYLKALAAFDNQIPFYVAFPSSTFDMTIKNGKTEILIEERSADEVCKMQGIEENEIHNFQIVPENTQVHNPGFDITPSRLITGLITERGICKADEREICNLYPEFAPTSNAK